MPFNISKNYEILPVQSRRQYSCFLTYDAESMARRLSHAYPVNWKIFDLETDKYFPEGPGSSLQYQMQISEGPHKLMILITPYTGNNIFSDYLDAFGEGFHHNCIMFDKLDEYKIQLVHLVGSGYSKVQTCSKQSVFESCILKHPEAEYMLELLFLDK